ncbi:reprolysin-like metallopeptidase [Tenacibaculum sp. 190524A05c]|uniref:zinc-dependent metalloprotease n=1 Tax=Tenacibaculum platacis TaxID=3137852 RepID=UPI0031FA8A23
MKRITLVLVFFLCTFQTNAQDSWKKVDYKKRISRENLINRNVFPDDYALYHLDIEKFTKELTNISKSEFSKIKLPNDSNQLIEYRIKEISYFSEPLNENYGFIKSYSIEGIQDKTETGKISIGTDGIHITIFSGNHATLYVDPYTKDKNTYIAYNRENYKGKQNSFSCSVENQMGKELIKRSLQNKTPNDGFLRTFRLALNCTGEYAQFHINDQGVTSGTEIQQKAAVLSAMNTTMTRVNGLFERDVSIRMNIILVNGENPLINLDSSTDGFTNNSSSSLLSESQSKCDNIIGNDNYDIGHVFSTGGGGTAILGSVCLTNSKGSGVTGTSLPKGEPFNVDFVAHEIGHQFGATHTFNNSCGGQRWNATAVEPGSGSTIMGYAGICPVDVQSNSDDHFHAVSISRMWNLVRSSPCATLSSTGNSAPVANAGPDVSVPKGTPLILRGNASDSDSNGSLTYIWEQIDIELAPAPPEAVSIGGALFRSFSPSSSSERYLPKLDIVASGATSSTWEVIPSVARELNFSLLVRDNNIDGGAIDRDDLKINVTDADPFVVTSQNTSTIWNVGSTQTITWNVSETNQAPINCENVRISLSTDGGLSFPIILTNSTPNDGTHDIIVPNYATGSARIMIEGLDNIFYNLNEANFSIVSSSPTFVLSNSTSNQLACNAGNASLEYDLNIDFVNGFNESVTLTAQNAPTGATVSFTPSSVTSDSQIKMVVSNLDGVSPNNYSITINATSNSVNQSVTADLEISDGFFSTFNLAAPINNSQEVSIAPNLTWGNISEAESYDIEIATDNAFNDIVLNANSTTNSYSVTPPLNGSTKYYWRVRGKNTCGIGNYTSTFNFTTENPSYCESTFSDDAGGGDHITNVTFNTINNTTGNDTVDGYIDYTSQITDVTIGNSYPISVTFDPDGFQDHCYVFIDWNQDFNFDIENERYDLGSISGAIETKTANISVPDNAVLGNTRMRVVVQYFDGTNFILTDGACDSDHSSEWGETEDYTLNIIDNTATVDDFDFTNFNVYPNPSNGNFNITFEVITPESVGIRLFDIRGRLVEEKEFKNTQNTFSEELNLEGINAGLYLLQVQNGNKRTTKKLIVK